MMQFEEFADLTFGDEVFVVRETNNSFTRKKHRTFIDGVEWFRYDAPLWTYTIEKYVYCGWVKFTTSGDVRDDEDRLDEYHFRHPEGQIYPETEPGWKDEYEGWFRTLGEAEDYATMMRVQKELSS